MNTPQFVPQDIDLKLTEIVVLKWLYRVPMTIAEATIWTKLVESQAPVIEPIGEDQFNQWADQTKAALVRAYGTKS